MSPLALNRLLFLLGVLGLFVSGVLSAEHLFQIEIPCTSGGGCETVARHSSSYVFGIPVAYIGFGGYILLTALALVRLFTGDLLSRLYVGLGYTGAAIGMVTSLYLQYVSFTQIHATCVWCLTSAITMVVTFIAYTMLFGKVGTELDTPPKRSTKALFQGMGAVLVAMVLVGFTIAGRRHAGPKTEILDANVEARLVPEPKTLRNQLGPDDAPATIVEFADLCCPTCRHSFHKLHDLLSKYPGKVRIIYRHFPIDQLKGHEMSLPATITAEIAAGKGRFWDFAANFTAPEEAPTTREGLDKIAMTVGITPEEINKAIDDPNSQAQKNMLRDFADARGAFNIEGTPTYILDIKGQPIKKMTLVALEDELEKPEVQRMMK